MRRKSPIQLPFADPEYHRPAEFDSIGHVRQLLTEHKPHDYTPEALLTGDLIGGRFLLKHVHAADSNDEVYIVGYYRLGMTWIPVAHCSSEQEARECAAGWAELSERELFKALWIVRERSAVPDIDIPREARMWHDLPVPHRAHLWRLIEAGAPGSIADLIAAGKACGLFSCT